MNDIFDGLPTATAAHYLGMARMHSAASEFFAAEALRSKGKHQTFLQEQSRQARELAEIATFNSKVVA